MNKNEFLDLLKTGLSNLSDNEIEEHLSFYSEMIDDRIEEGLTEQEAIFATGNINDIVAQIIADSPTSNKKAPKHIAWWVILLIALGCPIWLSLGISAIAVIISIYAVIWSVIISLWAVELSFIATANYGFIAGFGMIFTGNALAGAAMFGAAFFLAGFSIILFFGCKISTKYTLHFTKKFALGILKLFSKKGEIK